MASREHQGWRSAVFVLLPGVGAAVLVAVAARVIGSVTGAFLSEASIALLLGLAWRATLPLPAHASPGLTFALQRLLRIGIVLLGADVAVGSVVEIGLGSVLAIVVVMAVALIVALLVGRLIGLSAPQATLIAVGTAICGNTAIVAASPIVRATERETAISVAIITLLGTIAVFVYPAAAAVLEVPDAVFGYWAGLAVQDTSQVVATAAAVGPDALTVATVVKLTRNALMLPLIVLLSLAWADREMALGSALRRAVPLFVFGFIALAALNSAGLVGPELADLATGVARALILVALAAVGLNTPIRDLITLGPRPFALAALVTVATGAVAAVLVTALNAG